MYLHKLNYSRLHFFFRVYKVRSRSFKQLLSFFPGQNNNQSLSKIMLAVRFGWLNNSKFRLFWDNKRQQYLFGIWFETVNNVVKVRNWAYKNVNCIFICFIYCSLISIKQILKCFNHFLWLSFWNIIHFIAS